MIYLLTFANGQMIEAYEISYVSISTWEKMYKSKITSINGQPVYN